MVSSNPENRATHDRTCAEQQAAHSNRQQQQQKQQQKARQQRTESRIRCLSASRRAGHMSDPAKAPDLVLSGLRGRARCRLPYLPWDRFADRRGVRTASRGGGAGPTEAKAEAARQEAEAAARQRVEDARQEREGRRRIAMAGVGVLCLLFVARSCTADSRSPVVSSTVRVPAAVQPTPHRLSGATHRIVWKPPIKEAYDNYPGRRFDPLRYLFRLCRRSACCRNSAAVRRI